MLRSAKDAVHSVLGRFGYYIDIRGGRYSLRRRINLGSGDYVEIIRFAIGTPRNGLVLGAYEGNGVRHLAKAFPQTVFYAFEPDPDTYARLVANTADLPNAKPVQAAVGDKDGTATLYRNDLPDTNSLLAVDEKNELMAPTGTAVSVRVDTLDTFCEREKLDVVDYVHADLQGYELGMLRGATGLLAAKRIKMILLEVCLEPMYVGQASFEELFGFITKYGYRFVCTQGMFFEEGKPYPRAGNLIFVAP